MIEIGIRQKDQVVGTVGSLFGGGNYVSAAYKLVGRDYNLNVQRVTENTAARVGEVFIQLMD